MANKLVFSAGVYTPRITLKRVLFLFLLGIVYLTLVEAQGRIISERYSFEHLPARAFLYFKGSDNILYLDYSGDVWISINAGAEWNLVSDVPRNIAAALVEHRFSEDRAYILTIDKKHYKTSDKGRSWQEFTTSVRPAKRVQVLSFHAHREDYVLFRGTKCDSWYDCSDVTYYTTDGFGSSPKLLLENTDRCIWAHNSKKFDEAPEQSIFCIQYDVSGSGTMRKLSDYRLVESEDYFKEGSLKIIDFDSGGDVRGVVGLGESQEYLAAAVKDVNSLDMKMYVSIDGQRWARAFFPLSGGPKEDAYTILESPTNHLIVDLLSSESHNTGSLYFSNSNGTYFVNHLKHTNRNSNGLVDFKLLQDVGGILLVNIVSNYEEIDEGSAIIKKLQSKISFDDGITWKFIKPPEKNFGDSNFPCMDRGWEQGECSLHLHSVTSGQNNGLIFSANNAPGVLIGVGNVGQYLLPYDQCDTFLSYDGGLTWKVIRLGAHMYGIGHYGTILVIVDDEQPTEEILYSYDRGENWNRHSLGTKIVAKLLTTDSISKNFLLLGSAVPDHNRPDNGSGNYRHFTFKIDFSKLFDRDCNRDDFDDWVTDCFMGKKTTYHRRKADKRCFVVPSQSPQLPPPQDDRSCACTKRDFECDFNYIFDKNEENCIPLVPERIPDGECKDGQKTYLGSSGYRKVPENMCDQDDPESVKLDEPKTKECSEGHSGPLPYGEVSHRTANFAINSYFYFPESTTLMIKTTDGQVKRSLDEGTTWEDVLSEAGSIAYMFLHDHDKTRAYFFPNKLDKTYYMWYTTDAGKTFEKTKLENEPNNLNLKLLDFHPKQYDWLLFMAGTPCPGCHSITYFSPDNGKSWKEIETWADKCIFGKDTEFSEIENDAVFCSSYKDKNSKISQDVLGGRTSEANPLQLVKLKTDGRSKKVLLNDVVNFFVFNEFMAVATEERGQLLLHISKDEKDGSEFSNATFPPDISVNKQAYTILPSTTGSIFLDVYKSLSFGSEYGSLFKSDSNGKAFNRILDNTNRNIYGNVDFEKIQGLDGIIIANQVENIEELNEYVKKKIITKISYDDGSHWKSLVNIRTFDESNCQDCYLNLHGRTDINGPGGVFSAPSAIGLLIGVGNYGRYLLPYNECNTFMSRDGGRNWQEIRRGASLYEFGDQGTIIVIVDNKAPTDHVLYSWNYGKDWKKYIFTTSTPVRASVLTTNSNSTSMKFLLVGHTIPTSSREASQVVITIDFSQLENRKCKEDDFELWNPMDENSRDHKCLLGEEIKYYRRKADKECHIGEFEIKPPKKRTCPCTKHDFECAYGYWRNNNGDCELMGPDPDRPANCKDKYEGHSGYVKMKKSKCEGGENFDRMIKKDCNSGNTIISKTKVFEQLIGDYFYFNQSNTILVRTMDNVVWRSTDEGHIWNLVELPEGQKIYGIFQNPYFNNYAYLVTLGTTHFYTSDSGATFKKFVAPIEPNLLRIPIFSFHPDKPEYLIYIGGVDCKDEWSLNCHTKAYYTLDNLDKHNWKELETYVRICQWARNKKFQVPSNLIICESYLNKKGSQRLFFDNPLQLVSSEDFFKHKNVHYENTVGTAIFEEFMVVAELLPSGQSLRLWTSIDSKKFAETQFPPNMIMTQNAYTVLESVTNSIILHVTTTSTNAYGNILKSNGNGTYYSLSLGSANRDINGLVDFERMQGIKGIALANVVSNVNEVNMGNNKKLKSMITFNDGSTWKLLNRPEFDSDRRKYKCDGDPLDKCSLHLHSYTERRNPRDSFSSSSAIGLMMGVGNVGDYLTPYLEGDTFLTRDAGATWIEVKKGAYMYEFGDQGGIIVLADDEQPTDHILYSLNEGLSWQEYKFTKVDEKPIRIFDIDTMPGGISSKFILRGFNPSRVNEEIVVYLDFSYIFTRTCDFDKDFEKWSPSHSQDEQYEKCLFGHKITYLRKKREIECFIEDNPRYKREKGENCECSEHDFECDYNYMRNSTGECQLFPGAQPLHREPAEQCANGEAFWYELSGYRKLKASTCTDGPLKYTGESHRCPGHHSPLTWIIIVLSPFIVVGILTFCFIKHRQSGAGGIRLGSSIEPNSITDILYQIRMPRFISRLWSRIPLPGRRNTYRYSPVATDDGHEVLMDDYEQDNETL